MKNILMLAGCLVALSPFSVSAFAEESALLLIDGTVDGFNERSVELVLGNGAKVQIPRARVEESQDVRPGKVIVARVTMEDILVTGPAKN